MQVFAALVCMLRKLHVFLFPLFVSRSWFRLRSLWNRGLGPCRFGTPGCVIAGCDGEQEIGALISTLGLQSEQDRQKACDEAEFRKPSNSKRAESMCRDLYGFCSSNYEAGRSPSLFQRLKSHRTLPTRSLDPVRLEARSCIGHEIPRRQDLTGLQLHP